MYLKVYNLLWEVLKITVELDDSFGRTPRPPEAEELLSSCLWFIAVVSC